MRRLLPLAVASALLAGVLGAREEEIPLLVAAEVARIASGSLWPGFDPANVPLAIYDGTRTYLFRHPAPPAEFLPLASPPGVRRMEGRHPLVRANTSVALGGVPTATLTIARGESRSVRELAAIAVHEAFHVFQAERHPTWGGNEVDLFTYPVDDSSQLQLVRLETEALRRGLAAKRDAGARCWLGAAIEIRQRRFAALGESGTAYERGTELKEGLARLVEARFTGATGAESILPKDEFSAGDVRSRSYAVGHALGAALDRFAKGWEKRLETGASRSLDAHLAEAVAGGTRRCRFSRAELDASLARARRSVELALLTREAIRRDFLSREGWRVVVAAATEPLFPKNFDPLNVERVAAGEVLHTRWIELSGPAGTIEILDRRALTESAGAHPLFEGVRKVTVTGIPEEPQIRESSGTVSLRAPGITAEFRGARLVREGRSVVVTLGPSR